MELIFYTFKGCMAVFVFSVGFHLLHSPDISDFQGAITIDSLGPDTVSDIQIESYHIEDKRDEGHFRMAEQGDDETKTHYDDGGEKGYLRPDVRFQGFEYRIPETAPDHDNGQLTEAQIQENLIFVFYLYGDFILHGTGVCKIFEDFQLVHYSLFPLKSQENRRIFRVFLLTF